MLLNLNTFIISTLIREWITLNELNLLDSACCENKVRKKLIGAIVLSTLSFHGLKDKKASISYLTWLFIRGIRINKLFISHKKNDKVFEAFQNLDFLQNITCLSLDKCGVTSMRDFLRLLSHAPGIAQLDLSNSLEFTTQSVKIMSSNMKQLTSLTVVRCSTFGNIGMCRIASECIHLRKVHVVSNPMISDRTMEELCRRRAKQLTDLKFIDCKALTNAALASIATHLRYLEKFSVADNFEMSSMGVLPVAKTCGNLSELRFNVYRYVFVEKRGPECTNECVTLFSRSCPTLTYLHLDENKAVDDACLLSVAQHCPLLQYLNVNSCHLVSDVSMTKITENCKDLHTLLLGYCYCINLLSLAPLRKLRVLNARQATMAPDSSILRRLFAPCGDTLLRVDIGKVPNIHDSVVDTITDCCRNITHFSVYYCGGTYPEKCALTTECVVYFARLSQLEWLNIAGNFKLNDENLEILMSHCTKIRQIIGILLQSASQNGYRYASHYYTELIISVECERRLAEQYPNLLLKSYEIYGGGNYEMPVGDENEYCPL